MSIIIKVSDVIFQRNISDMTQNYAGTVVMMSSIVSSIVGALVPLISGFIIGNDSVSIYVAVSVIYDLG